MRTVTLFTLLSLCLFNVFADEDLYLASKKMIVDSTEMRVKAMRDNDFDKVCNAIGVQADIDTMIYYLSFEVLENEEYATRLSNEVGYFYYRNLESLYKNDLPQELHGACARENKKEIKDVMNSISSILAQE